MNHLAYWQELNPEMALSELLHLETITPILPDPKYTGPWVEEMREEGFIVAERLFPPERMARMSAAVERVIAAGGHEVQSLIYDDFWICLRELSEIVRVILGGDHRVVPMPYVNYVAHSDDAAGFGPHRDRIDQPFRKDGSPAIVTVWISLTDATPDRACLYVLPASRDPSFPHALESTQIHSVQDLRAVPVPAGSLICFNQALLHFGGRNSRRSPGPRISFAFELEREDSSTPRSPTVDTSRPLSLRYRLGFIGTVMLMLSKNRVKFEPAQLAFARALSEEVFGEYFAIYWR